MKLPRAVTVLVDFTQALRAHGFPLAHEQVVMFLGAVRLLGPKSIESIRHAAHATLAPPADRHAEFEALFHAFFFEVAAVASAAKSLPEEDAAVKDKGEQRREPPEIEGANRSGKAATAQEILGIRQFDAGPDDQAVGRLEKEGPGALPRRLGFRKIPDKKGDALDLRRSMRRVVEHDGDVIRLMRGKRKSLQRPIVLLIDISGSMKAHTADYLRYAHALTQMADKVESFAFGTRLTRITRALKHRDPARALESAAAIVDDWDGGTRIGPALSAFMADPRYASLLRGAVVLVLSDGLERGDPKPMREAVARIRRRAWYLAWLTPLAADPRFRPETRALKDILKFLDQLGNGGSLSSLVDHTLRIGSPS
ncbi:vWA domain-containing protein [Taklimakanibacter deserti]|uniref:vWA domain-containing protein n=1 Tax=Taklimakanibacter deserti TaxID=2267839 RepID=UPI000E65C7D5